MPVMIPAREIEFDYDELVNKVDELELSDENLDVYAAKLNSINESYLRDGGFTSISFEEPTPVAVFSAFFTEEVLNLITHQTNIYVSEPVFIMLIILFFDQ
jgi:hypothetical protein